MAIIKSSSIHTRAIDEVTETPTTTSLQYPSGSFNHKIVFRIITKKGMEGAKTATKGSDKAKVEKLLNHTSNVIVLAHPNELTSSYSQNWDSGDGYYNTAGDKAMDTNSNLFEMAGSLGGSLFKQAIAGASRGIGTQILADDISLSQGVAINPFLGVSYKSPSLRTIEYSFPMQPKNRKEVEDCLAIIHAFKWHSSPEYAGNAANKAAKAAKEAGVEDTGMIEEFEGIIDKAILKYPDFFFMESYMGVEKNETIPRFGPAVCTNVSTNYSPQGLWRTFESGAPVNMLLSLSFQEMEIVTRERLKEGY
ncbi:MAG: baseplate tail-tube junction protein [Candidatus Marinimicrobia bacterium]|nr:baseplate tail-tube junction protein [Candidatus Neomarinimicrobiota bacterium]